MAKHPKKKPKVLLLFDTDKDYRRGFLRGISGYCNTQAQWEVHLGNPLEITNPFEWIQRWNPDGLFYESPPLSHIEKLTTLDLPVVIQATRIHQGKKFGQIVPDNRRMGAIAAEHFIEKGFQSFGYFGYQNPPPDWELDWSMQRCEGFCQTLQAKGFTASVYEHRHSPLMGLSEKELTHIADWLKGLAHPVAVFACNDRCACDILDACRLGGLSVPGDIAVLGVDNEESMCNFFNPPLSSIGWNTERAGFEGAGLLDRLMAGRKPESHEVTLHPKYVVERQSTDILLIPEKEVATALRYIRKHANQILAVSDVVKAAATSRRSLERKFADSLGCTIHEEVVKSHIQYIMRLLMDTDMPILNIARSLGYSSEYNMSRFFLKATGYKPTAYRGKFGIK